MNMEMFFMVVRWLVKYKHYFIFEIAPQKQLNIFVIPIKAKNECDLCV